MHPEHNTACRFYRGDRPCSWNKADGSECATCTHAELIQERILIVKLDAMGDVLRSTVILPKLRAAHPGARITWLTRSSSAPLLDGNPYVDQVWLLDDPETLVRLDVQQWDLVLNLDNAFPSSALAARAKARHKTGFVLSPDGVITPTNDAAREWITLASFDRLKKANTRSYQQHMYAICGFSDPIERPVLRVSDARRAWARSLVGERGTTPLLGLNTGAGGRWPLKMMSEARLAEVLADVLSHTGWSVLLLGGPAERERNEALARGGDPARVRNAGCEHPVGAFAALVEQCDALLCGDTLALHVATALGVPSVAVFCPTSVTEIHAYDGLIRKLEPVDCACLSGYNRDCPWGKDCINAIPAATLREALQEQMARGLKARR